MNARRAWIGATAGAGDPIRGDSKGGASPSPFASWQFEGAQKAIPGDEMKRARNGGSRVGSGSYRYDIANLPPDARRPL